MENENTLVFSLSDNQKQNAIFKALNPEKVRYYVFDTYDDYALVFDFETEKTYKVGYTKNEDDTVSVSAEMEEVYMEYVTKDEKNLLILFAQKAHSLLLYLYLKLTKLKSMSLVRI